MRLHEALKKEETRKRNIKNIFIEKEISVFTLLIF